MVRQQEEYQAVPIRFHVSVDRRRVRTLEITRCDFKLGWCPLGKQPMAPPPMTPRRKIGFHQK